jgi:hypothetical protein
MFYGGILWSIVTSGRNNENYNRVSKTKITLGHWVSLSSCNPACPICTVFLCLSVTIYGGLSALAWQIEQVTEPSTVCALMFWNSLEEFSK